MADTITMPCAHETDGVPSSVRVADYHPLTWDELESLVSLAFNDRAAVIAVQCRLVQAVPGHECPHRIDGPVAAKQSELEDTFVEGLQNGEPGLARKIGDIIGVYSWKK